MIVVAALAQFEDELSALLMGIVVIEGAQSGNYMLSLMGSST